MSTGRILFIRGGAIGDFILTLPALAAVKRQFPTVGLEVIGYPHIACLARAGGLVTAVRPVESRPLASFFARRGELAPELAGYFAEFHVIFTYLFDPDELFRDNLAKVTKAQVIQGPHRPNESQPVHAAEQLLEPLQRLAIFDADPQPRLELPTPAPPATTRTLAVHPGSGGERKNWPEASWATLLQRLAATTDRTFLLVGGEAEGEGLERLAAGLPPGRVSIARSLPLPELALRLRACAGFLGHDSGISHLAAALGLPGIVLWGPSNATVWRPRSDRFELLTAPGGDLASLTVAEVWAHVETWVNRR
ncbi:MAG TPA: glycosyltransferase family 9 protein [Candidatus Limnocylindria bacterium]|jgi:heptosyltransferase-2|nr:glycosyltransferase family 9 protein [Candidatus Limnocylindria bacterium]